MKLFIAAAVLAAVAVSSPGAALATPQHKPAGLTLPVACVAVPTSTGGHPTPVGYCPPGTKPTKLPSLHLPSGCVPLPVVIFGRGATVGYCP